MGIACNNVISGDYKNGDIKLKGLKNDKIVLIHKGLLGKTEIELNKSTVDRIVVVNQQYQQNGVEIYFKNGKKSMATVDNDVLNRIKALFF
ncbi:hypothetical protein [Clostridium cellulovorans]|uniref:Uncharacterized protein n=1 Tax=Clostridium cellulovorans (strain ATCC 35296 / DSM 3052 / OCM 3 / 743B) TaxID=573061 RepID=D9SLP4_CLOC7|nr:hypothetical protein [Clostridium cellulovorans]ADL53681.1 hypothetical protein Clocel_4018 [Clostridium cellulovorans 743B]